MIYRTLIILIVTTIGINSGYSQSSHKLLRKGDQSYRAGEYEDAESFYRKSAEKDDNLKSNFNLGNTTYQLERYEEAVDHYLASTRKTQTTEEESKAFYNLGNAYFKEQNFQEALNAYKHAIKLNGNNDKARYNLTMTKELLKRMQQEQQQNQEQNQEQDQENNQEQNQEQQNEDQQGQDQQEQKEQEQSESQQDSTDQMESRFDSSRLEKQNLDSLDAAKLLQIIQNEEQKVQEKLRKFNSKRSKPDKDW